MEYNLCPIMAAIEANAADTPIGDFDNVTVADKRALPTINKLWHNEVFWFQALCKSSWGEALNLMNLAWGPVNA